MSYKCTYFHVYGDIFIILSVVYDHMEALEVDFRRLRRHYESVKMTYDEISLLDLSHTLRVWVDRRDRLPEITHNKVISSKLFKSYSPNKSLARHYKNCEYLIAFMPDGVITHADKGEFFEAKKGLQVGGSISLKFAKDGIHGPMKISEVFCCNGLVAKDILSLTKHPVSKKLNFIDWIGAEVVRINFKQKSGKLELITIPRKILISRVANVYGGSHPFDDCREDQNNKYDKYIEYLFDFKFAGCPLPYFLLMKIAQDMLDSFPKIVDGLS